MNRKMVTLTHSPSLPPICACHDSPMLCIWYSNSGRSSQLHFSFSPYSMTIVLKSLISQYSVTIAEGNRKERYEWTIGKIKRNYQRKKERIQWPSIPLGLVFPLIYLSVFQRHQIHRLCLVQSKFIWWCNQFQQAWDCTGKK